MRIAVPVKQVPETSNVKLDPETGTMVREGQVSVLNPLDLHAVELAIQLRERLGGDVTVVTMGPESADVALREAIAMGCDEGCLVTGRDFAGSDTWATSRALSAAIRKLGGYDVVVCGERATDGDTCQVGPGVAAWLGVPVVTYVSKLVAADSTALVVERLVEDGYETLEVLCPCVLTVVKEAAYPRLPTLRGKQRARGAVPTRLTAGDLALGAGETGLKGSPTRVVKIYTPRVSRDGALHTPRSPGETEQAVDALMAFLDDLGVL